MTNTELSGRLMPTVSDMLAKERRIRALESLKNNVVHEYALIALNGGEEEAEQELGRHRRDQLTFFLNSKFDLSSKPFVLSLFHPHSSSLVSACCC